MQDLARAAPAPFGALLSGEWIGKQLQWIVLGRGRALRTCSIGSRLLIGNRFLYYLCRRHSMVSLLVGLYPISESLQRVPCMCCYSHLCISVIFIAFRSLLYTTCIMYPACLFIFCVLYLYRCHQSFIPCNKRDNLYSYGCPSLSSCMSVHLSVEGRERERESVCVCEWGRLDEQ